MSLRKPQALLLSTIVWSPLMLCAGCDDPGGAFKCGSGIDERPIEGRNHVDPPAMVSYRDNPPASGDHYPVPAAWGVAQAPIPREQWVHNLEHGGIVLLYNCPSSCQSDVDHFISIRSARPADIFNEVRVLITSDTLMPHKFAALAWGWRWQGDAIDDKTINCFIDARYDKGPESIP